jgi:hypothetical protein
MLGCSERVVPRRPEASLYFHSESIIATDNLSCRNVYRVLSVWNRTPYPPHYAYGRAWHERQHGIGDGYYINLRFWSGP